MNDIWKRTQVAFTAACIGVALGTTPAAAQIEVLLRGLQAAPPKPGACGRYRFEAEEPTGPRRVEFTACIERVEPGPDGSVFLRLSSGDSLNARIEVAPELFAGHGGSLLDYVREVEEVGPSGTKRLQREDWASLPGFDAAPKLAGAQQEDLGARDFTVGNRKLASRGVRIHESNEQTKPLGNVQMTQKAERDVESWLSPDAPILGVVRSTATLRSERKLSAPVAGVPQEGVRTWRYVLELMDLGAGKPPKH